MERARIVGTAVRSILAVLSGEHRLMRIWGTAATITAAILGGAHIIRVHDVSEMAKVARVADAIAAEI